MFVFQNSECLSDGDLKDVTLFFKKKSNFELHFFKENRSFEIWSFLFKISSQILRSSKRSFLLGI